MTASRNKGQAQAVLGLDVSATRPCRAARAWFGVMVAAMVMTAATAWAQTPLTQPFDPDTMERMDPPSYENVGKIAVDALKAPNPESVGLLDSNQGGFPATLWQGSTAAAVRKLIPMLPANMDSRSMRSVERRVLLTAAPPPQGIDPQARPSLLEMRAERLLAMGELDAVGGLIAAAPASVEGGLSARVQRDAHLLAGRNGQACAGLAQAAASGDAEAPRLAVFCHLVLGRSLEGNLALDLLRESQGADTAFIAAAEKLAGLPMMPADKIEFGPLTPLHAALFAAAKMAVPDQALAQASPLVARAAAENESNSLDSRIAAAERVEALAMMSPDDLRKLYLAVAFAPDELSAPMERAAGAGIHGRALLFRAAIDQPDAALKAKFTAKALEIAAQSGRVGLTARVFEPLIAAIRPDPSMAKQAPLFARAMYALNRPQAAAKWLDMAKDDADAVKQAQALWPLTAITESGPGQPLSIAGLAGWREGLRGLPPETIARRSGLVLGLLAGLGVKVPDIAWLDALSLPRGGPQPALFAMMQGAALEARLGAAVLPVLANMGETPLDKMDVMSVSEAVSALSVVGLSEDARILAVEAMLANGI